MQSIICNCFSLFRVMGGCWILSQFSSSERQSYQHRSPIDHRAITAYPQENLNLWERTQLLQYRKQMRKTCVSCSDTVIIDNVASCYFYFLFMYFTTIRSASGKYQGLFILLIAVSQRCCWFTRIRPLNLAQHHLMKAYVFLAALPSPHKNCKRTNLFLKPSIQCEFMN